MKYFVSIIMFFGFTTLVAVAHTPPTCNEEPTRRDCVKVEDPDATPPKHTVNQNKKKPVQLPVVKPRPKVKK